jgi:L-lactate dehydrogenase
MKIGIVGSGFVGATAAYAMVMQGIGREIVLIDKNTHRAQAEADDILHAVPFAHPLRVRAGDYTDLKNARVVIISAGANQQQGETRLHLLERNAAIFREIVPQIITNAPDAVLVVATNPVDVMTHLTARYATDYDIPSSRVLGSGTMLDTARFRSLVARECGVDPFHVHGYVVGEHGDSEVLSWSSVTIGNIHLEDFCNLRSACMHEETRARIDAQVRQAAYRIIEGKGATYYGVGSALARLTRAIVNDQRAILTVCTPQSQVAQVDNVTVSVPHLVGGDGCLTPLPLNLNSQEMEALHTSANLIRQIITDLDAAETPGD